MYVLTIKGRAAREIGRIDRNAARRVAAAMRGLAAEPRPRGARPLAGATRYWRIRVGDYRVVYAIDDGARKVDIQAIGHRSDVYRHL